MVKAGEEAELVNAQRYTLTNSTDSLTFDQMYNLRFNIARPIRKRTTTDGVVRTIEGSAENTIEADVLITTPEITTMVGYTQLSSGALPTKNWDVQTTDRTGTVDTLRFTGRVTGLSMIRQMVGGTWFHLTIQTTVEAVTEV